MPKRSLTVLPSVLESLTSTITRSSYLGVRRTFGDHTPEELWRGVVPAPYLHAIDTLNAHPTLQYVLDKNYYAYISAGSTLILHFTKELPVVCRSSHPFEVDPAHPLYPDLCYFAAAAVNHRAKVVDAHNFVDWTVRKANTLGQLARMWPEVVPFVQARFAPNMKAQLRRSRLPAGFEFSKNFVTMRTAATELLALGVMVAPDGRVTPDIWIA